MQVADDEKRSLSDFIQNKTKIALEGKSAYAVTLTM